MKKISSLFSALLFSGIISAQAPLNLRVQTSSSSGSYMNISDFIPLPNGNNLALINEGFSFNLTEIDNAGNSVSSYGFANQYKESYTGKLTLLGNGNYGVLINAIDQANLVGALCVFEISPAGNIIAEMTLPMPPSYSSFGWSSIYETMKMKTDVSGNFYVTGSYFSENFVFKFNQNLGLQWQLHSERDSTGTSKLPGFDIEFCDDSSFYYTEKNEDSLVISRIGTNGNIYFSKTLSDGNYRRGRDMIKVADGSLYIAGLIMDPLYNGYSGLLMKYDANLNLVFQKEYSAMMDSYNYGLPFKEMQIVGNEIHMAGSIDGSGQFFLMRTDLDGNILGAWLSPGETPSGNHQQEPFSLSVVNGQEVFDYYSTYLADSMSTNDGHAYIYRNSSLDPSQWCGWTPVNATMANTTSSVGAFSNGFAATTIFSNPVMQYTSNYSGDTASVSVNDACSSVGISKIDESSFVKIFPNPSSGQFKIEGVNFQNGIINVLDINGKLVKSVRTTGPLQTIDLNNIGKGMYVVQIVNEGKIIKREKLILY